VYFIFILNFYINNKLNQIHKGLFETNIMRNLKKKLMKSDLTSKQRIFCERQIAKEIYVDQNRLISITDEMVIILYSYLLTGT